jgi:thiol-disulfide isomerase/thioredoxin
MPDRRRLPTPGIAAATMSGASQGEAIGLADFRGKVVLLNIWATWCAPCRREMPTLERLQAELGGPDFEVVALSIDRKGISVVKEFYDELGLRELGMYVDTSAKASRELGALGVPTTLLIDREGNEIGRLLGPAEWDSPEMVDFIRGQIRQPSEASVRPAAHEQLASRCGGRSHAWASPFLPVTGRNHLMLSKET